jgi:hypothetical protein
VKFIKTVEEGGTAPRFYGVAWRNFRKPEIHCAPVPLNHLIRISRQVHHRLKYPMYFFAGTVLLEQYHQLQQEIYRLRAENAQLNRSIAYMENEVLEQRRMN